MSIKPSAVVKPIFALSPDAVSPSALNVPVVEPADIVNVPDVAV